MTNPNHTDTSRSDDPVAWMYERLDGTAERLASTKRLSFDKWPEGWTETPLYPADSLEALKAEVEGLRGALWFYSRWGVVGPKVDDAIRDDGGDIARAALGEK